MTIKTLSLTMAALLLAGCNGSSDGTSASTSKSLDSGTVQIAMTDATDDFLTYQINVNSITLIRADGTEVDVVATSTEVDFVQYQDLSELFAVASIPVGTYTSIVLNLDYTDSDIVIQDGDGNSYTATAVDSNGDTLGALQVTLQLSTDEALEVTGGNISGLTLDLDLAASNEVLSYEPALVEVEPFLMVVADQDDSREHRVRGLLTAVDTDAASITLAVRPMRLHSGEFGELVFTVTDETLYEVDGIEYTGSEGLALIAALDAEAPLLAYGTLSDDGDFTASQVIAGLGVAWSGDDVLKGVISARSGDVLTLTSVVSERHNQDASFASAMEVVLGDSTVVTGYYQGDADIDQLSVGQKVLITGTQGDTQFDASSGLVRMQLNQVTGAAVITSPMTLDLLAVNGLAAEQLDFSNSGESSSADLDAYVLDTGSLDLGNVETGNWLAVRGYPTAWGHDTSVGDFTVLSVDEVSFATAEAGYSVHWDSASDTALTITDDQLIVDITDAIDGLRLTGVPAELVADLTVSAINGATEGTFGLRIANSSVSLYLTYAEFLTALAEALTEAMVDGTSVTHLTARGYYDEATGALTADNIMVRIGEVQNQHSEEIRNRHAEQRAGGSNHH